MAKQLNIRNDEAFHLAHAIADQTGKPITEIVATALKTYAATLPSREGMTPEQRATVDWLRDLSRRTSRRKKPGVSSDHTDMYDEFGLPI